MLQGKIWCLKEWWAADFISPQWKEDQWSSENCEDSPQWSYTLSDLKVEDLELTKNSKDKKHGDLSREVLGKYCKFTRAKCILTTMKIFCGKKEIVLLSI